MNVVPGPSDRTVRSVRASSGYGIGSTAGSAPAAWGAIGSARDASESPAAATKVGVFPGVVPTHRAARHGEALGETLPSTPRNVFPPSTGSVQNALVEQAKNATRLAPRFQMKFIAMRAAVV